MNVFVAGVDHRTPIDIREKFAFTASQAQFALETLKENAVPAILISTCNRTELWCEGADAKMWLRKLKGQNNAELYSLKGDEAAEHLFKVAVGLESKLVGEDQILGQVKEAAERSKKGKYASPLLNQLFRVAISAAKEVKTETRLTMMPVSAPQTAAELAKENLGDLRNKNALIIGNGVMGRMAALALRAMGANVWMTKRQESLQQGCDVEKVPYDERYHYIENSDIIISATASPHYTITADKFSTKHEKIVMVDLAVPRDIDPKIKGFNGVLLYDVDNIGFQSPDGAEEAFEIWEKYKKRLENWLKGRDRANEDLRSRAGAGGC